MAQYENRRTKAGRRRIRVVIRRKGYRTIRRTFPTLTAARSWARRTEANIAAGRYLETAPHTVDDLVTRYIQTIAPQKKSGHRSAQQLRTWSSLIGPIELNRLRPADIATARDAIASTRGPATVVRYLSALSHAFTIAIKDWQWMSENPVKQIMWPSEPRGRVRFLSERERDRLLSACARSKCRPLSAIVTLALVTGMRRNEIVRLRWSNVDLERHRLILTDTKNRERRQVPLARTAMAIMALCNNDRPCIQDSYIFHARGNRARPVDITHAWNGARREAGLADFRFHDLRHSAASYLAMTGATTNEIAEILGHKTLDMVKRYAHLTTSHSAKVLERMDAAVFNHGAHADETE